jgi:molybdate transport repressor ModE-like protein
MTPDAPSSHSEERRYFKEVRFRQIRALVETAKHGNFAEASRQLGMSTPSVWRQVRALEEDYGVCLLQAHGRSVRLTEDGARLVELAAPLVEGFDSLKKLFTDSQSQAARTLRLVAPAPVLNGLLRDPIIRYRAQHPTVRLSLVDCPSQEAWELLDAGNADLAVVGAPLGTELPSQLEATPLDQYPFHAVCSQSHPFAQQTNPSLKDLLKQPLILPGEKSSSRIQINHLVAKAGLSDDMNVVMIATQLPIMLNYVALGFGVAILTRPALGAFPIPPDLAETLVFRDISHVLDHDRIVLLSRKGRFELPHIRAFRELLQQAIRPAPSTLS